MLHDRTVKRIGFTLVELLAVIAIIAILVGLGSFGIIAMMGRAQTRNTESTLRVVNKLLMDRWSAVISDAKKESISAATVPAVFALANNDVERARVIWVKVRLMEAFPEKYADVTSPTSTVALYIPANMQKPHFAKYQTLVNSANPAKTDVKIESAACLLMALKTLSPDGLNVEDQLGPAVADTDGDGLKEVVDGWGKPVHFKRFGTFAPGSGVNPAATTSTAYKYADTTDPGGKLLTPTWFNAVPSQRLTFDNQFHAISPDNGAHANYVIPVIADHNNKIFGYTLRGN
jgi:prepilin-type N-terminal cleavage/methylation domain-containing protein